MAVADTTQWERGARRGPRRWLLALVLVAVVLGGLVAAALWLFNTPGVAVAFELFEQSPGELTLAHYAVGTAGDQLTLQFGRELTREEADEYRCSEVVPRLNRENLTPRIVIGHARGSHTFATTDPCQ